GQLDLLALGDAVRHILEDELDDRGALRPRQPKRRCARIGALVAVESKRCACKALLVSQRGASEGERILDGMNGARYQGRERGAEGREGDQSLSCRAAIWLLPALR